MSNVSRFTNKQLEKSAERKISVVSFVCSFCNNFDRSNPIERKCAAFPDGIPLQIWKGENDHTKSFPGDNGILFEPMLKKAA